MEKLAIVVPCYNEEEVLKIASEALRGVLDDLIRKGKKTLDDVPEKLKAEVKAILDGEKD